MEDDDRDRPVALVIIGRRAVDHAVHERETTQKRRRVKRRTINTVIWFVVLLALTAIVLYPLVWLFFSTFKPSSEFGQNPGLIPENPTVANYVKVVEGIAGTPLWRFFANSFFIAIMAVIGTLFSSALAAYAFARIRFRGVGILFAAMIGTLLLPFHVIIIPQYIMFQKLDLVDTYVPLILPKFLATEAFFVFLIVQFIRNIPRDMDEAARIDGAGHIRIFFSIMLPLIKPALITSATSPIARNECSPSLSAETMPADSCPRCCSECSPR